MAAAALKEITEVTECSICTEAFTDPRLLPCVHTYCLKCILCWGANMYPGDLLACPLCRDEFVIPRDGLEGLPKNFFMENMLRIKELMKPGNQSTPCDICTYRAESGATQINPATNYCVQYLEHFCDTCACGHRRQTLSRDHKLLQFDDMHRHADILEHCQPTSCEKHVDERLKIYCNECRLVICMMCYATDHNSHRCSDINELFSEFCKQMTGDITSVENGVEKCKQMLQSLAEERRQLEEHASRTEQEIREKTKQLKQMIDEYEESLVNELRCLTQKRIKEVDNVFGEVERRLTAMQSYTKYGYEMREKGTASDVARASAGLHDRAEELVALEDMEHELDALGHAIITFLPSDSMPNSLAKFLGELKMDIRTKHESQVSAASVTHVLPGDSSVYAVTTAGNKVYVLRTGQTEVDVYDNMTLRLERRLSVPQIAYSGQGIAACDFHKCLYLSDFRRSSLIRLDLGTDAVMRWSVAKSPKGLSMTREHNVLVTCSGGGLLQEYTTDGCLVREICLHSGVNLPGHAIELSTGHYVVSQWTSPGVVSVVGKDGQLVRSYGNSPTSNAEMMNNPRFLSVTKDGDVLVADYNNDRILAINSSFSRAQEFPLPADLDLQGPRALYLDASRDRLYIGECGGDYRVIAVDNVKRIQWK